MDNFLYLFSAGDNDFWKMNSFYNFSTKANFPREITKDTAMYSSSWGLTAILAIHLKLQLCSFAPWKNPLFSWGVALAKRSIIGF